MSLKRSQGSGLGGAGDSGGALGSFYSHDIDQSLRFNDGDNGYLKRTVSSTGNRRTWTWSGWVKKTTLATGLGIFGTETSNTNDFFLVQWTSGDFIFIQGYTSSSETTRLLTDRAFRDPSAWYHIVVAVDTTQSVAANRLKLYVNGEQITDFTSGSQTYPNSEDLDTAINDSSYSMMVGAYSTGTPDTLDGYLAEVYFIDGTALAASTFGETKDGIWIPKEVSGVTFGTNGFYLPFSVTKGHSCNFDSGRDQTVTFTNASHYDIGSSDDFTIEFWFNTPDVADNYGNFINDYSNSAFLVSYDFRSTTRDLYLYTASGQALKWDISANVTLVDNTWHHLAIQRDGTTLRAYVDGTRLTTIADAAGGAGYTLSSGKATDFNKAYDNTKIAISEGSGGQCFVGLMSNLRIVIGDTVYADNDSAITVPTSTLTNVTGTKLLAFTTNVITKDSSSNDVTGSTANGPLHRSNTPFSVTIGDDNSTNTNDFTPTNLSFYDVVLDSPTNNFCTFNTLAETTSKTISEGNLKVVTPSSGYGSTFATFEIPSSGKWYFEGLLQAGTKGVIGVSSYDATKTYFWGESGITSLGYYAENGTLYGSADSGTSYGASYSAGDIIGVAVNADDNEVTFYKNNSTQGTDSFTPDNLFPMFNDFGSSATATWVANFGQDSTFAGNKARQGNADGEGKGDFYYSPPSGFIALCSANLSDSAIGPNASTQADEHFNTVLWTGTGSSNSITGVGFQPDFVWIKNRSRSGQGNVLHDAVRGHDGSEALLLVSETTAAETHYDNFGVTTFNSDGFTVIGNGGLTNLTSDTYVAWNWKGANTTASNTDGNNITSTVSANTTAGFSIVSYEGTGLVADTVGHGLDQKPDMVIVKNRDADSSPNYWHVNHASLTASDYNVFLNLNSAETDVNTNYGEGGAGLGSSTVIDFITGYTGSSDVNNCNNDGSNYIAYCFHSVEGYSKVGSYVGNGSTDGTFVYTGFRPAWIIQKKINSTGHWQMWDSTRNTSNEVTRYLLANATNDEYTDGGLDMVSNGFKPRKTGSGLNASGDTYIYLAFAEAPFKYANAR